MGKVSICTIPFHSELMQYIVECWDQKVELPPPSMIDLRRPVEVTSVNWEDQDAAVNTTFAVVSYRWHGIMYVVESLLRHN